MFVCHKPLQVILGQKASWENTLAYLTLTYSDEKECFNNLRPGADAIIFWGCNLQRGPKWAKEAIVFVCHKPL